LEVLIGIAVAIYPPLRVCRDLSVGFRIARELNRIEARLKEIRDRLPKPLAAAD
jgi:hypothetical protein